jgi:hypothetical protein
MSMYPSFAMHLPEERALSMQCVHYNVLSSTCVLLLILVSRIVAECEVVGLVTLSVCYCHVMTVCRAVGGTAVLD